MKICKKKNDSGDDDGADERKTVFFPKFSGTVLEQRPAGDRFQYNFFPFDTTDVHDIVVNFHEGANYKSIGVKYY